MAVAQRSAADGALAEPALRAFGSMRPLRTRVELPLCDRAIPIDIEVVEDVEDLQVRA